MLKKMLILVLCVLLLNLVISPSVFASEGSEKEIKLTEKVKTGIAKLGTGPEAKVELKLKDGTKLKGYVTEIGNDQFYIMDSNTDQSVAVSYSQVKQAKGNNLSSKTVLTIGLVGIFVLLFVLLHVQRKNT